MFWQFAGCVLLVLVFGGCQEAPPDGHKVFLTVGCTRCHGNSGEGASQGPPLEGLSEKFKPAELNAFLENPIGYAEQDARLKKWREEYFTPMPKLEMTDAQRQALVSFLLKAHP